MTHLGERITDFVFGELSPAEMEEARRHLADCKECADEVRTLERTRALLKMSPDIDPPRRIVFETQKRPFLWRWLAPVGVAAALLLAVIATAPIRVQWQASQLTIAFGTVPSPPVTTVNPLPAAPAAAAQPVDYKALMKEFEDSQRAWLESELSKRDAERRLQMERVQGQFIYLQSLQNQIEKQGVQNASDISVLAQRSGIQD